MVRFKSDQRSIRKLIDMGAEVSDVGKSLAQSIDTKARNEKERSNTSSLLFQLKTLDIPEPRSLFHPDGQLVVKATKAWRIDLAWPDIMLAVELQGLKGHTTIPAYIDDCRKAGELSALGWTVLPVVSPHIVSGEAAKWIAARFHFMKGRCDGEESRQGKRRQQRR